MAKKKITIDDLAVMVKKGFDHVTSTMAEKDSVNKRFDEVNKRFDLIDKRIDVIEKRIEHIDSQIEHINARLTRLEHDVSAIRHDLVRRNEFEDLMGRVSYLERKFGVKSGK